uniref:Uncharacterized protein n=1 Tax=Anguilla anguilla TaxID=7936 RepID=A0A0E9TBN2_ANGAN
MKVKLLPHIKDLFSTTLNSVWVAFLSCKKNSRTFTRKIHPPLSGQLMSLVTLSNTL